MRWAENGHAPYRTVTVRDCMSDLPEIENGCAATRQHYRSEQAHELSHFQREMRKNLTNECELTDHVCKDMVSAMFGRKDAIARAADARQSCWGSVFSLPLSPRPQQCDL